MKSKIPQACLIPSLLIVSKSYGVSCPHTKLHNKQTLDENVCQCVQWIRSDPGHEWGNIGKKTSASLSNNAVENKIEKKKKGNCKALDVNAQMQKNENINWSC